MQKTKVYALVAIIILLCGQQFVHAQEEIVYGVFFYSPHCGHCQQVIQNDWPSIQQEFGDQLRVLFIDASTARGNEIMSETRAALQIEATGVPMLIIGDDVMVGSLHIPARARDFIRAGLEAGGIELPAVPSIQASYQAALTQLELDETGTPDQITPDSELPVAAETIPMATLFDRLAADPIANGLALAILVLLVMSLFFAALGVRRSPSQPRTVWKVHRAALLVAPLVGLGMTLSLLAGSDGQPQVIAIAVGEFIIFSALLLTANQPSRQSPTMGWRVPLTALAGLGVAAYLASIEITQSEAVCGLVGNCNLVQQSPYAQIAGIPIGVIGVLGYTVILLLWTANRFSRASREIEWTLRAIALVGTVFSTYLTFLELFVIGAVCLWCLTSAVIMFLLLWMVLPVAEVAQGTEQRVATV